MTIRLAGLTLLAPLILLPEFARTTGEAGGAPPTAVPATPRSGAPSTASAGATYRVVQRLLEFTDPSRVTDPRPGQPGNKTQGRTLPTTIWYPAPPARGPFPLVLFSHGLLGLPSDYEAIATRWSGAGFVVVAPTYPLTSRASPQVQPLDVPNQPADASFVITAVLKLAELAERPIPRAARRQSSCGCRALSGRDHHRRPFHDLLPRRQTPRGDRARRKFAWLHQPLRRPPRADTVRA